ncbi:MAG: ComF family protein [Methylococcaceae bacterium]|nr:ComF family protein [Methylococcaceae bacterium]
MNIVYNWLNIIQDYLLPPTCILCANTGWQGLDLCYSCYTQLAKNSQCCYHCARPLEIPAQLSPLCGNCLSHPPAFDTTYAPFIHHGAMRHLIAGLKFNADYKNARLLGVLLAEGLTQNPQLPDCIMPVPLHKARYRERGFNQSIEIARTAGKALQIPVDVYSCIRHRDTPHQTQLTAKQRRSNMKNAFSIIKPITTRHIAIVDDVMTTGSTVHELAVVLKKAGAARVDVWICARAN